MPLKPEEIEGLDSLLENANEAAPEWKDEVLGILWEDVVPGAKEDMKGQGIEDDDEQESIVTVVAAKACYLAYQELLSNLTDDARDYIRAKIEGRPVTPAKVISIPKAPATPGGFTPPKVK